MYTTFFSILLSYNDFILTKNYTRRLYICIINFQKAYKMDLEKEKNNREKP